jgi:hypothetical protein
MISRLSIPMRLAKKISLSFTISGVRKSSIKRELDNIEGNSLKLVWFSLQVMNFYLLYLNDYFLILSQGAQKIILIQNNSPISLKIYQKKNKYECVLLALVFDER